MADIFAEVDQALKQERLEKLWKQHGKWIVVALVAIILGTAINEGWESWNESIQARQTSVLLTAADSENMPAALAQAAPDLRPGLRGIALLTAAGALVNEKKIDEALALYEKAANDSAIPSELRDLAILMNVRLGTAKEDAAQNKDAFLSKLQSISSNIKSPWRFQANLETAVILANFNQDYKGAQAQLDTILTQQQLPETLTSKARALKHVYTLRDLESTQDKGDRS